MFLLIKDNLGVVNPGAIHPLQSKITKINVIVDSATVMSVQNANKS